MPSRFSFPRPPGSISTGYDNQKVSDVVIPSCGIEDVDVSLFNLFDKELRFFTNNNDTNEPNRTKKVPVIFAAGEKWAQLKNNRPIYDKSGTIILPLITIMRNEIVQEQGDIVGRGINQQTGEIKIQRRLDSSDRNYQNMINRLYLKNQKNLGASPLEEHLKDQFLTDAKTGDLRYDEDVLNGALMAPKIEKNIYEILTIPAPQFFTAKYEITFWTQYTQQMNDMLEIFISSFLPQGRCFRLDTKKGYWFVASVDEGFTSETNFDDSTQQERLIKYRVGINVPAYLLASSAPGAPVPVRRYVSSPSVDFKVSTEPGGAEDGALLDYQYLGADDPTLPKQQGDRPPHRSDLRNDGSGPLGTPENNDPALAGYPRGRPPGKYLKIGNRLVKGKTISSFNGETTYKGDLNVDSASGYSIIIVK